MVFYEAPIPLSGSWPGSVSDSGPSATFLLLGASFFGLDRASKLPTHVSVSTVGTRQRNCIDRTLKKVERCAVGSILCLIRVHLCFGLDVHQCAGIAVSYRICVISRSAVPASDHPSPLTAVALLDTPSAPAQTHPLGKLSNRSLCAPSEKLATLNQLTGLFPLSSFLPELTPIAYLMSSRPVDVGITSGVSARRPMSCIFASDLGVEVEKARALGARMAVRRACMLTAIDCW